MLKVRSVADMNCAIVANLARIDRRKIDVVVGIPRSGMIPASLIATHLQLPLADVESFAAGRAFGRSGALLAPGARVLLVDDTSNHGRAMARAVDRIGSRAASIVRCAVYGPYRGDHSILDLFFEDCPGPRAFQWNLWKHLRMPRWGFDLDGVLVRDPTKAENDDGDAYLAFMAEGGPLFVPSRPIGHIVTCRLEKYRAATEAQLARLGVNYAGLHMMPYATKAERMAAGGRGAWKAARAAELGVELFIESDPKQAGIIAREAQIPVWCTRTQALA